MDQIKTLMKTERGPLEPLQQLQPLQLGVSSSMPQLRNAGDWLNTLKAYPSTMYRLNHTQRIRWLSRQKLEPIECDESPHNLAIEEEPEDVQSPKQPGGGSKEAMIHFYAQYRSMKKSTSPFHCKAKSAAFVYLNALDKLHQLPKPMGVAKWKGPPTELNLEYDV